MENRVEKHLEILVNRYSQGALSDMVLNKVKENANLMV